MTSIPLERADGCIAAIIAALKPGDEIVFTQAEQPVATLRVTRPRRVPRFGTLAGTVLAIAPDFDAIPEGFEE